MLCSGFFNVLIVQNFFGDAGARNRDSHYAVNYNRERLCGFGLADFFADSLQVIFRELAFKRTKFFGYGDNFVRHFKIVIEQSGRSQLKDFFALSIISRISFTALSENFILRSTNFFAIGIISSH